MNTSSDAAEQIVKISLDTAEAAVKVTGTGAKNIAVMIYAVMKDQKQTKGKTRLNTMLKSGQPLKVYSIRDDDLRRFCSEAKKYGVLYCVLKDKNINDGMTDIMVREFDASKINRIFDKFDLANVDKAIVNSDNEKNMDSKETLQNLFTARKINENLSGHTSKSQKNGTAFFTEKKSVRQILNEIKSQHRNGANRKMRLNIRGAVKNER